MVPLLPDKSWEFHDSFVPSERAGPLVFFSANDIRLAFSCEATARITFASEKEHCH